jgi:hypothetical protein
MAINIANFERQTTILQNTNTIIAGLAQVGKTPRRRVFTTNGTWQSPAGVSVIFVTGGGGGGGGGVHDGGASPANGQAGGVTSFSNLLSLSGGGGGRGANVTSLELVGGSAGGMGGQAGYSISRSIGASTLAGAGNGGGAGPYKGGMGLVANASTVRVSANGGYCSGGGGVVANNSNSAAGGGGSGDFVTNFPLTVIPNTGYGITIGVGGSGGTTASFSGGNGGQGILIIEWWE